MSQNRDSSVFFSKGEKSLVRIIHFLPIFKVENLINSLRRLSFSLESGEGQKSLDSLFLPFHASPVIPKEGSNSNEFQEWISWYTICPWLD